MSSPTIERKIISCQTLVMMFGVLLAALLFATPHRAQSFQVGLGLHREGTNDPKPPVFRVRAMKDKKIYDTLEGTYKEISYKIKAKGRCPDKHHLSTSSIGLRNGTVSKGVIFPVNENNRSLGGNQGQDWNYYNLDFPFLLPKLSPVETCNAEVKRRVDAGQSLGAILQNGFSVFVDNAYEVNLVIGCEKNVHLTFYELPRYYASATLPATIECRPTGYVPPDPNAPQPRTETKTKPGGRPGKPLSSRVPVPEPRLPTPPPPLTSVSVAANPAETTGRGCPLYVNFKGKIEPNPDSKYTTFNTKYRFVGDRGYQTDWIFVAVSRSEPRTVNGRRFIQPPANNPGGTILAPGEKPKIPLYRGWMELEVMLPNATKRSERADFSVDCNVVPPRPRIKASNE